MSHANAEKNDQVSVHAVVDRIEDGGLAVLLLGDEEKSIVDVPVNMLPPGASGGDHLVITFSIDKSSRAGAEERVRNLRQKLERRSSSGGGTEFKL